MTCHKCNETLESDTEDKLVDLGMAQATKHDHAPRREHVIKRVRGHNPVD